MLEGMYSAATAMDALSQNHEVIAQNLAHVNTPGYQRRGLTFQTLDPGAATSAAGAKPNLRGTQVGRLYSVFESGGTQFTGNPLDVAISGDGFFVVNGPNGPLYTRNGTFTIDAQGNLQTNSGLAVLGTSGPIAIPPSTSQITITENGTVLADRKPVGQLQLAKFADPQTLVPAGDTLFAAPAGAQPQTGTARVQQGYREGSNVQPANEMVAMISGMRQYEAAQRALRSLSETMQMNTKPQGS